MTTLNLPFPPSVNNLFFNARGRGRVITPAYREWRNTAGWRLKEQRPETVSGPVTIEVTLEDGARKGDADNYLKAPIDLLVEHGIIELDGPRIVRKVSVAWDASVEGCQVRVEPA